MKIINSLFLLIASIIISSCIVVKNTDVYEESNEKQVITLSPKPTIAMSDEIVRSVDGDMIAFLPQDWFFVNILNETSADVIAVAVNKDYTLSAVFTKLLPNDNSVNIVRREGVIGLARIFYEKKLNKSAGSIKKVGNTTKVALGPLEFGQYMYIAPNSTENCRSAVFVSNSGTYYEFSLIPMTFRAKQLPTEEEIDNIFKSIISTIQY